VRRYRVLLPLVVHTADGAYSQGEEFDAEFSREDEAANLASGLLELLPMRYRNVGGSEVWGAMPGDELIRALPLGEEELLVAGGHLERIDRLAEVHPGDEEPEEPTPAKRAAKRPSTSKKEH